MFQIPGLEHYIKRLHVSGHPKATSTSMMGPHSYASSLTMNATYDTKFLVL